MEFADCKNFSDICECMGRNEHDYDIVPGVSAKENANMYHNRLMLIAKCANGDSVVNLAGSNVFVYTPIFTKAINADSPFGFCLKWSGCDNDNLGWFLDARPPFLKPEHAIFAGITYVAEFEGWVYYLNRAYQEI